MTRSRALRAVGQPSLRKRPASGFGRERPEDRAPFNTSVTARDAPRLQGMLDRTTTRTLPVLNRAAEFAPAAQACCGVCRTCATTNIVSLAIAGIVGIGVAIKRVVSR